MTTTTKNKKAIVSLDAEVYSKDGKKVSDFSLPSEVFGLNWNADLVHQVITSLQTAARHPYAHAKTRGEVSGGGKKPWKQKGTGRARHGSTRSPIWVGGGVAHGPNKEKNFDRKVNKKTKNTAIKTCSVYSPCGRRSSQAHNFLKRDCIISCLLYTSPSPRD